MGINRKFTRIPKVPDLLAAGIPTEVIPTYCALSDYGNNKTGLCWPKMETLAAILNRSVRTVQRHLHLLAELGVIEFVKRRRYKGRFSSYLYKVLFIATTGHQRPKAKGTPNIVRTKPSRTPPKSPTKSVTEGYEWLFGNAPPQEEHQTHTREQKERGDEAATRRKDGYSWLFG